MCASQIPLYSHFGVQVVDVITSLAHRCKLCFWKGLKEPCVGEKWERSDKTFPQSLLLLFSFQSYINEFECQGKDSFCEITWIRAGNNYHFKLNIKGQTIYLESQFLWEMQNLLLLNSSDIFMKSQSHYRLIMVILFFNLTPNITITKDQTTDIVFFSPDLLLFHQNYCAVLSVPYDSHSSCLVQVSSKSQIIFSWAGQVKLQIISLCYPRGHFIQGCRAFKNWSH